MVLPGVVTSKMVDRAGRSGRRKVTCGLLLLSFVVAAFAGVADREGEREQW